MILSKCNIKAVDVNKEIQLKISSRKLNELLWIVPTNRKIRQLKREIISISPGSAAEKINLETIGTFASALSFNKPDAVRSLMSESTASVLIKLSANSTSLKYFSYYKDEIPSGTLERLRNVISEYKKNGITPDQLLAEAGKLEGSEKLKAIDIANIYQEYNRKCRSLKAMEIGDVYAELNSISFEEFLNRFIALYPDINLIIINGFDEFTSPEIEIISNLADVNGVKLFVLFDYFSKNNFIFSHLDLCYNKLIKKGFSQIKDLSIKSEGKFQKVIKEKLFFTSSTKKKKDFNDNIILINAVSRENEVELIAKEIKILLSEGNVKPNQICVAFNQIKNYSNIVRDYFSRFGIPLNLTDRFNLSESPPVISIINFLEILENDFYYKNIFRALSSNYFKINNLNLTGMMKTASDLKIIAGFENWNYIISDAVKGMRTDEDDSDIKNKNGIVYSKALEDLKFIKKLLLPFSNPLTADEFLNELVLLLQKINLHSKLINSNDAVVEQNIKAVSVFIDEIKDLFELLKPDWKNEKKSIKFYLNHIRTAVLNSRYNVKEQPGYGVLVTSLDELRGLKFDYEFIGGLIDGDLPTRYMPEIFFAEKYLKNEMIHYTEERFRFYQALCVWNKKLYLSFPQKEDKRELTASVFLNDFCDLFDFTEKSFRDYSDYIFSKDELLNLTGRLDPASQKILEKLNLPVNLKYLNEQIKISKTRENFLSEESEYSGYIKKALTEELKKELEKLKHNQFSTSQLETYALCPYKYFAERILKIQTVKPPTEELEALEMGTLLHGILYEFYKKIKKENITVQNCNEKVFKKAETILFNIAEKIVKEANFQSPLTFYEKEKILGVNGNKEHSILYQFLLAEKQSPEKFIPTFFEFAFGNFDAADSASEEKIKIGNVFVRGKIDRIDVNEKENKYIVVDYKLSGKAPSKEDLNNGISLQLPLYMIAAKQMISAQLNKDFSPVDAQIFSLKFTKQNFGKNSIRPFRASKNNSITDERLIEEYNNLMNISAGMINNYVNKIADGIFHLSSLEKREEKVCRNCNFKSVCRIKEYE